MTNITKKRKQALSEYDADKFFTIKENYLILKTIFS